MTVNEAREIIKTAVLEAVELCKSNGFCASGKVYYSDKALRECSEFNENVILLFGAIRLGVSDMDEEDFCTYGLCCETKVGMVNDSELEAEVSNFKDNVQKLLSEITASPAPKEKIKEINLRQEKEAEESMNQFNLEMKKMKLKLYGALGVLGLIIAGVIIASLLI